MQTFPFNPDLSTDECTTLVRQCRADAIFDISMSQEKGKVRGVASGWVSTVTVAHAAQSDTHSTVSARGSASARSMPDSRKSVMRRTIPPPCRSMLVGKRDSGHGPRLTTGAEKHAFGARSRIRKRRHARGRDGSRPSAGKRVPNASRYGSIRVLAATRAAETRRVGPGPAATTTNVDGARTPRARPRPCRSPGPSPSRSTRRCPTRPSSGSCAVSRRRRHRQARPPSDESALRAAPSSRRTPAN